MKNPNEPITNRCVKIYTEDLDKESFDIIKEIAILYSKTKNKFYWICKIKESAYISF